MDHFALTEAEIAALEQGRELTKLHGDSCAVAATTIYPAPFTTEDFVALRAAKPVMVDGICFHLVA